MKTLIVFGHNGIPLLLMVRRRMYDIILYFISVGDLSLLVR